MTPELLQQLDAAVVMACCGDVPTLETLTTVSILREYLPELKIRVINVVDLMKPQQQREQKLAAHRQYIRVPQASRRRVLRRLTSTLRAMSAAKARTYTPVANRGVAFAVRGRARSDPSLERRQRCASRHRPVSSLARH